MSLKRFVFSSGAHFGTRICALRMIGTGKSIKMLISINIGMLFSRVFVSVCARGEIYYEVIYLFIVFFLCFFLSVTILLAAQAGMMEISSNSSDGWIMDFVDRSAVSQNGNKITPPGDHSPKASGVGPIALSKSPPSPTP